MATYDPYGAGNSDLMAVFDRNSNNVPDSSRDDSGYLPGLPQAINGYIYGSQSTSSVLNAATQQSTLKINHILQNGIPLWNPTTTYGQGAFVQSPDALGQRHGYFSLVDSNHNLNPASTSGVWSQFTSRSNLMLTDMSNATLQAFLAIMNVFFPVGSLWHVASENPLQNVPPLQGQLGVVWNLLPDGYVIQSSNISNAGISSGSNNIGNGFTNGTAITIAQMPSHNHNFLLTSTSGGGAGAWDASEVSGSQNTSFTGGGEEHDHFLDIMNMTSCIYIRVS